MIDIAYYITITGFFTTLLFGLVLVFKLSWKAGFKDVEKFFTKEHVNSEHIILKRIIILGNTLLILGFVVFIVGKIMGRY